MLLREFDHAVCKIQNPGVVSPIHSCRMSGIPGRMSSEVPQRLMVELASRVIAALDRDDDIGILPGSKACRKRSCVAASGRRASP
jgi:hypothetical protein